MTNPIDGYCTFLETLTPTGLEALATYVADDVRFCDPFNDVRGRDAMARIFHHMFETLGPVTFTIDNRASDGATYLLSWRFAATLRGRPWTFDGTSVVTLGPDGRVVEHIDHWDAARHFYARLPVIGWLLAWLRGRLAIH